VGPIDSLGGLEALVEILALAGHAPAAIDLNQPGSYLNWNVFTVSVANLVLIAVMVAIFGVALLLPFPRARGGDAAVPDPAPDPGIAPGDERMWTARARRRALASLPPHKLLPDRQPAYVASWVYVFGVASLAALGVAIVSGFAIAIGGPTGGTPTRSGTSSTACTCGASSCSWRCWSSTCGASSGWPPGAAAGA
jgi:hypothetical protein